VKPFGLRAHRDGPPDTESVRGQRLRYSVQGLAARSEYVHVESPLRALEERMSEREVLDRLDRIAVAAEKAARRLWWIALPIYLSVGVFLFWVVLVVLTVLRQNGYIGV
jgi:hypothetical protein